MLILCYVVRQQLSGHRSRTLVLDLGVLSYNIECKYLHEVTDLVHFLDEICENKEKK